MWIVRLGSIFSAFACICKRTYRYRIQCSIVTYSYHCELPAIGSSIAIQAHSAIAVSYDESEWQCHCIVLCVIITSRIFSMYLRTSAAGTLENCRRLRRHLIEEDELLSAWSSEQSTEGGEDEDYCKQVRISVHIFLFQ